MNRWLAMMCVCGTVWLMTVETRAASRARHWIGGGGHYWTTVDGVDLEDIDEDGVGWFVSYQYRMGSMLSFEADVEMLPDGFAGAKKDVYAPQAYLLLGSGLYAGVGIGGYYSDGDFAQDPFYAFKGGINLELVPNLNLDVSANYRFTEWDDEVTDDIDTDTMTLAAALRLGF